MAVDTSAIIAILFAEPEAQSFEQILFDTRPVTIGPVLLESTIVLTSRAVLDAPARLQRFMEQFSIAVVPFEDRMTEAAQAAFMVYGKSRHPARLNFGDCMIYAAAKILDIPLLYKGTDFGLTDMMAAA